MGVWGGPRPQSPFSHRGLSLQVQVTRLWVPPSGQQPEQARTHRTPSIAGTRRGLSQAAGRIPSARLRAASLCHVTSVPGEPRLLSGEGPEPGSSAAVELEVPLKDEGHAGCAHGRPGRWAQEGAGHTGRALGRGSCSRSAGGQLFTGSCLRRPARYCGSGGGSRPPQQGQPQTDPGQGHCLWVRVQREAWPPPATGVDVSAPSEAQNGT